jgi:hypothetical protein
MLFIQNKQIRRCFGVQLKVEETLSRQSVAACCSLPPLGVQVGHIAWVEEGSLGESRPGAEGKIF